MSEFVKKQQSLNKLCDWLRAIDNEATAELNRSADDAGMILDARNRARRGLRQIEFWMDRNGYERTHDD